MKAVILASALLASITTSAIAHQVAILQPHKSGINTIGSGSVTSCSKQHSGKCIRGPVRNYSLGQKVRLPGGTWVDCAGDCRDTLRAKTVDFWYEQKHRN